MAIIFIDCFYFMTELENINCCNIKKDARINYNILTDDAKKELIRKIFSEDDNEKKEALFYYEMKNPETETFKLCYELTSEDIVTNSLSTMLNIDSYIDATPSEHEKSDKVMLPVNSADFLLKIYPICKEKLNFKFLVNLFKLANRSIPMLQVLILNDENLAKELLDEFFKVYLNSSVHNIDVLHLLLRHPNFSFDNETYSICEIIYFYSKLKITDFSFKQRDGIEYQTQITYFTSMGLNDLLKNKSKFDIGR